MILVCFLAYTVIGLFYVISLQFVLVLQVGGCGRDATLRKADRWCPAGWLAWSPGQISHWKAAREVPVWNLTATGPRWELLGGRRANFRPNKMLTDRRDTRSRFRGKRWNPANTIEWEKVYYNILTSGYSLVCGRNWLIGSEAVSLSQENDINKGN